MALFWIGGIIDTNFSRQIKSYISVTFSAPHTYILTDDYPVFNSIFGIFGLSHQNNKYFKQQIHERLSNECQQTKYKGKKLKIS